MGKHGQSNETGKKQNTYIMIRDVGNTTFVNLLDAVDDSVPFIGLALSILVFRPNGEHVNPLFLCNLCHMQNEREVDIFKPKRSALEKATPSAINLYNRLEKDAKPEALSLTDDVTNGLIIRNAGGCAGSQAGHSSVGVHFHPCGACRFEMA